MQTVVVQQEGQHWRQGHFWESEMFLPLAGNEISSGTYLEDPASLGEEAYAWAWGIPRKMLSHAWQLLQPPWHQKSPLGYQELSGSSRETCIGGRRPTHRARLPSCARIWSRCWRKERSVQADSRTRLKLLFVTRCIHTLTKYLLNKVRVITHAVLGRGLCQRHVKRPDSRLWCRVQSIRSLYARVYYSISGKKNERTVEFRLRSRTIVLRVNVKAKFHYRSLSYAWYRCRLSFSLFRLCPSKGGCAPTLCTDLPSAAFSIWHFYNQCLFNSFCQVIWLECESKVSL